MFYANDSGLLLPHYLDGTGGGGEGSTNSYRYWRIYTQENSGGALDTTYYRYVVFEFASGVKIGYLNDPPTDDTYVVMLNLKTGYGYHSFTDGNNGVFYENSAVGLDVLGYYGSKQELIKVTLRANNLNAYYNVGIWWLEYSDNGSTWTKKGSTIYTRISDVGLSYWDSDQTHTYTL